MIQSRLGLKALVLSGLVLGLMAFASVAQAETGATWLVNGAAIPGATDLLPKVEIREIENNTATLEFTTGGGTLVQILCTSAKVDTGTLLGATGSISLGTLLFHGCLTSLNKVASKNCTPHSAGQAAGLILTLEGEGLIVLDGGKHLIKITPETAGKLSKHFVTMEMGELCAIGESVNVETTELGEGLWIEDGGGNTGALTAATTHLIREAAAPLHKLLALGKPATIVGTAVVGLAGVHEKLTWKGDWN